MQTITPSSDNDEWHLRATPLLLPRTRFRRSRTDREAFVGQRRGSLVVPSLPAEHRGVAEHPRGHDAPNGALLDDLVLPGFTPDSFENERMK